MTRYHNFFSIGLVASSFMACSGVENEGAIASEDPTEEAVSLAGGGGSDSDDEDENKSGGVAGNRPTSSSPTQAEPASVTTPSADAPLSAAEGGEIDNVFVLVQYRQVGNEWECVITDPYVKISVTGDRNRDKWTAFQKTVAAFRATAVEAGVVDVNVWVQYRQESNEWVCVISERDISQSKGQIRATGDKNNVKFAAFQNAVAAFRAARAARQKGASPTDIEKAGNVVIGAANKAGGAVVGAANEVARALGQPVSLGLSGATDESIDGKPVFVQYRGPIAILSWPPKAEWECVITSKTDGFSVTGNRSTDKNGTRTSAIEKFRASHP